MRQKNLCQSAVKYHIQTRKGEEMSINLVWVSKNSKSKVICVEYEIAKDKQKIEHDTNGGLKGRERTKEKYIANQLVMGNSKLDQIKYRSYSLTVGCNQKVNLVQITKIKHLANLYQAITSHFKNGQSMWL